MIIILQSRFGNYNRITPAAEDITIALQNVAMTVSERKCHFEYQSIELLGRRGGRLGLATQEEKVKAIMELTYPKMIGDTSEIFGQFNYHRRILPRLHYLSPTP
jgi:hypothetical protein